MLLQWVLHGQVDMSWLPAPERPHLPFSTVPYLNIHFSFRIVHYIVPFCELTQLPVDLKWTNFNRLKTLVRICVMIIDIQYNIIVNKWYLIVGKNFLLILIYYAWILPNWANNISMREYQIPLLNPKKIPHYFQWRNPGKDTGILGEFNPI